MKLFYTPRSHFSRKVRILAAFLDLDLDLLDVGNVADQQVNQFGPNPLMKVPTLQDGEITVMDSDHIAQYLVRKSGSLDRFQVFTQEVNQLNARAVMNGIMAAEVELILAMRTGLDIDGLARFSKLKASMHSGIEWLEANAGIFPEQPTYLAFHLVSMWDHLKFYSIMPLDHCQLGELTRRFSQDPKIAATAPI